MPTEHLDANGSFDEFKVAREDNRIDPGRLSPTRIATCVSRCDADLTLNWRSVPCGGKASQKIAAIDSNLLHAKRHRYSRGSTETLLNEDLNIVFRGRDVTKLIDPLKQQFGRLTIEPADLAGRGANSPLFSLAYLALKDGGAKDWFSGLGLSLTHQGRLHFIQWHHIFPKALLKGQFETGEINEIANMAFITGQTNRRLSNKAPADYLPAITEKQGAKALASQCVPEDTALLTVATYRDFLAFRRRALAERMNAFIHKKAGL